MEESQTNEMNRRQRFIVDSYYRKSIHLYDTTESRWAGRTMQADSPDQEKALRTGYFKDVAFSALLISYTAGEPIDSLIPRLEKLISSYEIYQQALAAEECNPNISPLAIDDWPEHYEECVQVISLCILLHHTDLLTRFVALIDRGDTPSKTRSTKIFCASIYLIVLIWTSGSTTSTRR